MVTCNSLYPTDQRYSQWPWAKLDANNTGVYKKGEIIRPAHFKGKWHSTYWKREMKLLAPNLPTSKENILKPYDSLKSYMVAKCIYGPNKALCSPQHLKDIVPISGFDCTILYPWKKCLSVLADRMQPPIPLTLSPVAWNRWVTLC